MVSSTFPVGFDPGSPGSGYTGCCCDAPKPLVCPEVTVFAALQDICVAAGEVIAVMLVIPVTPAELSKLAIHPSHKLGGLGLNYESYL